MTLTGHKALRFVDRLSYVVLAALLCALILAGCTATPPHTFAIAGESYRLPAERNAPAETTVREGVAVTVHHVTFDQMQQLGCGDGVVLGCAALLDAVCAVWLFYPDMVSPETYARMERHELAHCNGHTHKMTKTESGLVVDWLAP